MDSITPFIIPLSEITAEHEPLVGGKATKLSLLSQIEYRVPKGFSVTTKAYQHFIIANQIDEIIAFELGKKPFESMRWEEIWDSSLRIRNAFLSGLMPFTLKNEILQAYTTMGREKRFAVRSSSPKEDSGNASFAGLHESYLGVEGPEELVKAVMAVWASLWSDGALLYQHELGLDPRKSSMAVLVQEMVEEEVSGVAFGADPREPDRKRVIIEAVPGLCHNLVDGTIAPDSWILDSSNGTVLEMTKGEREEKSERPLLDKSDINNIYEMLCSVEEKFGWKPDTEWTGRGEAFTLLQARPITTNEVPLDDERSYYLTLRPGEERLKQLAYRVSEELIPELQKEGERLAREELGGYNDKELAEGIRERFTLLEKWKKIYWDEFIPFAHGVRHLATYYNDAVHPTSSYEFTGLLQGEEMIAGKRNRAMRELARFILNHRFQTTLLELTQPNKEVEWESIKETLGVLEQGTQFLENFEEFLNTYMDISYGSTRLKKKPLIFLQNILQMASLISNREGEEEPFDMNSIALLEERLFEAVGPSRKKEAQEVLHIARLSWKLRDDDNLLLGRIESQVIRAVSEGAKRLQEAGRLTFSEALSEKSALTIATALVDDSKGNVLIPSHELEGEKGSTQKQRGEVRQLVGQPAAPGIVSGLVRVIASIEDIGAFQAGEVLVCDAIQPNMTHLVPLSTAIIERRGGMLIHGAIIAREMGIPCVSGIPDVASILQTGDLVTVDGHLGIITVGEAEFDLELRG